MFLRSIYTHIFFFSLHEINFQASSLGIKQISEDDLLEMIRTKPKGKVEDIKPTKTKLNINKILNKSKSDKSSSPSKVKASLGSPKKIKTPPSSPVKTKISSPISKPDLDTSSTQKVHLDSNLTYICKSKITLETWF